MKKQRIMKILMFALILSFLGFSSKGEAKELKQKKVYTKGNALLLGKDPSVQKAMKKQALSVKDITSKKKKSTVNGNAVSKKIVSKIQAKGAGVPVENEIIVDMEDGIYITTFTPETTGVYQVLTSSVDDDEDPNLVPFVYDSYDAYVDEKDEVGLLKYDKYYFHGGTTYYLVVKGHYYDSDEDVYDYNGEIAIEIAGLNPQNVSNTFTAYDDTEEIYQYVPSETVQTTVDYSMPYHDGGMELTIYNLDNEDETWGEYLSEDEASCRSIVELKKGQRYVFFVSADMSDDEERGVNVTIGAHNVKNVVLDNLDSATSAVDGILAYCTLKVTYEDNSTEKIKRTITDPDSYNGFSASYSIPTYKTIIDEKEVTYLELGTYNVTINFLSDYSFSAKLTVLDYIAYKKLCYDLYEDYPIQTLYEEDYVSTGEVYRYYEEFLFTPQKTGYYYISYRYDDVDLDDIQWEYSLIDKRGCEAEFVTGKGYKVKAGETYICEFYLNGYDEYYDETTYFDFDLTLECEETINTPARPTQNPGGNNGSSINYQKYQVISIGKIKTYKAKKLKKKKATFSLNAKTNGNGTLSYKVTKGKSKYITVNSKGKVTLKKKCKKGTYKIAINATGTRTYKPASRTVFIRVK